MSNPADRGVAETETLRNPEALEKPESGGISTTDLLDFQDVLSKGKAQVYADLTPDEANVIRQWQRHTNQEPTTVLCKEDLVGWIPEYVELLPPKGKDATQNVYRQMYNRAKQYMDSLESREQGSFAQ